MNKQSQATRKSTNIRHEASDVSSVFQSKYFIFVLALSALFVGVYIQLAKNISSSLNHSSEAGHRSDDTLIVADNLDAGYLDHIVATLLKFGYKLSFRGSSLGRATTEDLAQYNLIWTHDYPFTTIKKLEPHQRINHFPGTGFITNKITLSTTPGLPNVLKAFRLPAESKKFRSHLKGTKDSRKKLWIRKTSSHRGISIQTFDQDDTTFDDQDDNLVQEYMSNPMLIDGKKFDIGIYAVLTSVDPLRVYIYNSEALLRFCAHPYFNENTKVFNSSDIDSYVVGDDYTPVWLMPSLLRYYIGANLSMKQSLNSYLTRLGKDGRKIWLQIEETIKWVYKLKEPHLARLSRAYQESNNYNSTSAEGSLNQFFEMVRFDFIVDDDLNVYLMEANMSPNLSSRHFPPNRLLYEQVLQSYFSLVGLTQYAQRHLLYLPVHHVDGKVSPPLESIKSIGERWGLDEVISEKDVAVNEDLCVSDKCHMNCVLTECKLCYFCLDYQTKLHLKRAIYEQQSQWNFKRLLPSTRDEDLDMQLVDPERHGRPIDSNFMHTKWFRAKCHSDSRFCSS